MDFTQKDMTTLMKGAGLVATVASKVRRRKGTTVSKEDLVHVSHMIQSHDLNNMTVNHILINNHMTQPLYQSHDILSIFP